MPPCQAASKRTLHARSIGGTASARQNGSIRAAAAAVAAALAQAQAHVQARVLALSLVVGLVVYVCDF